MSRVLIVDDSPATLFLLRSLLTGYQCETEEARSGEAALALGRHAVPDLLIADLYAAGADGESLLRHWRTDAALCACPVVVYADARTNPYAEQRAMAMGAAGFAGTSADPAAFLASLREALTGPAGAALALRAAPEHHQAGLLREYSRLLVRTLEEKIARLEQINRDLRARDGRRDALIALTRHRTEAGGDRTAELRLIVETAARTLAVARVAVWRYRPDRAGITCVDMFDAVTGQHSAGAVLSAAMYPAYFAALEGADVIAASDAMTDPRTCEFAEDYLEPRGVGSMLDVPTIVGGAGDGVLSLEHVGPPRQWTEDEKIFAAEMGALISLALDAQDRR
jgi:CheY-like chemotaxis protein